MIPTSAEMKAGGSLGMPRHDLKHCRIPRYARAVIEALRFNSAAVGHLTDLGTPELEKALRYCDKAQLTLLLHHTCKEALPPWAQARVEGNLRNYSVRFDRLKQSLFEIASVLEKRGIEFAVLKGPAHSPHFTPDPLLRAQGDIDIWCEPESVLSAQAALVELGYRPAGLSKGRHLPPMIRETHWEWSGDYFAPDLPVPVELHYRLWDEDAEFIPAPGEREFWDRRNAAAFDGRWLPVLWKPDALAFASLHLMMHLLHGDMRLERAWELAFFLQTHAHNRAFWSLWQRGHSALLRRLEAIVFQLVSDWFDADLGEAAEEEIDRLPDDVKAWIARYALSPLEVPFRPNKDELWLHLALVESARGRRVVFFRRIFPLRPPLQPDVSAVDKTPSGGAQSKQHRWAFLRGRLRHHGRALVPALVEGIRWAWLTKGPQPGFLRFQTASAAFSLGVFMFLLLYNLHLLDAGLRENLIGRVAGALTLGTLTGAASAAAVARRHGLRETMVAGILGSCACMILRALSPQQAWLLATSFLHGIFLSLWTVSFSPAIAALTTERNRQFAFSLACSASVCVGVLAGVVGGWLPGLIRSMLSGVSPAEANRIALLAAACVTGVAVWPAAGLRLPVTSRVEERVYPRGRFLAAFLVCLGIWSIAVGAFNPFFNTFFARHLQMSAQRIGLAFALSHVGQVVALLSAPLILKRLGQVDGIAWMQFATGLALVCLALSRGAGAATASYAGYMSLQYMSEPGVFSLLMSRVAPGERSGASALYILVTSTCGTLAALAAGGAVVRLGYPSVLVASAGVAAVAAFLFRSLLGKQAWRISPATSC